MPAPTVTDDPLLVSVPGTHNLAMGCPINWTTDCASAELEPQPDGSYARTFDLPAGSYEFKIAVGGSWDVNYGAGGVPFGSNIRYDWGGGWITFRFDPASRIGACTAGGGTQAHWADATTVLLPQTDPQLSRAERENLSWTLHLGPAGGLRADLAAPAGPALALAAGALSMATAARFPALRDYQPLAVDASADVTAALRGQLLLVGTDEDGIVRYATGVQIPGVVDDVFPAARQRTLGVSWVADAPTVTLWAPTAQAVALQVWADVADSPEVLPMQWDADGCWSITGEPGWRNRPYRYLVTVYVPSTDRVEVNDVTDPYSAGLTANSTHSLLVDLADPALRPPTWPITSPSPLRTVDRAIYELHVRDFSIEDRTVPVDLRGKYLAFTVADSAGMSHLASLAAAGLNTVHLLPTFDFATVRELASEQHGPLDLSALPADSEEQQQIVAELAGADGYNWGYDPFHWQTPEGSYAVGDGLDRIREFRQMVDALHEVGLHVVLDQVYNHTAAAGQDPASVLDRIVPGYYHRLCARGAIENSTCCFNVATEHTMAEKLMVESVVLWARHYRVDGFRFDLMGHHSRDSMLAVRAALDGLTPAADGVDGRRIYLYGEGWNFGEVADDRLFAQARQGSLSGTGIGTFNDRLRDAVHGGGSSDAEQRTQGFGTGLFTDPNPDSQQGDPASQLWWLRQLTDLVQLGLAGNLRTFVSRVGDGRLLRGAQLDYNGQAAGYCDEPDELVNYVDAHDNQTLFDILLLRLPDRTPMSDLSRMSTVCLATATLSQSPCFWQAGTDLLRSKSFDANSYNSGDWFNAIDWSGQSNGFGRGLPPKSQNGSRWYYQRPLLADPANRPSADDIAASAARARDLLRLRASTPLFRLGSASLIEAKLRFPISGPSAEPGVIVMSIDDTVGPDVDPALDGLLVVFNASPSAVTQLVPVLAGRHYHLSPVQVVGSDPVVWATIWDPATGAVTVPGRSVAVLVEPTR